MSERPKIPKPICLQSPTESFCSCSGCKGNPSSNTSFRAITETLTAFLKLSKLNVPSSTNSDKFILPNKQLPPAGNGSSAQGLTPAYSNSGSNDNRLCDSLWLNLDQY